jgi:two-component system, cell cycle response regulator DivK
MARVLVIEDNASNLTLATFLLESAGHTVLSATDAEAGLAIARAEHPELILMDIQLPGMDGLEATALLKGDASTRGIPVIALTALAMKGDEERIRAAGCDGYIAKPLSYREFLAAGRRPALLHPALLTCREPGGAEGHLTASSSQLPCWRFPAVTVLCSGLVASRSR